MNSAKSFKIALRTALGGLLLYAVYLPIRFIPFLNDFLWTHRTVKNVLDCGADVILLLSIIVSCLSIFVHRKHLPSPDRQLRVLSHVAAWGALAIVLFSSFHIVRQWGMPIIWVRWWWQEVIILLSAGFLWKFSSLPLGNDSLSKPLSAILLLTAISSLVVLLMLLFIGCVALSSGLSVRNDLGTFCFFHWIRACAPAVIFPCYAIHIYRMDGVK